MVSWVAMEQSIDADQDARACGTIFESVDPSAVLF